MTLPSRPGSSKSRNFFSTKGLVAVVFLGLFLQPLLGASHESIVLDAQTLGDLESRAQQANPRDQCFLYTELVNGMAELAAKQVLEGDIEQASATLKRVEHYTELIHLGLAKDTKRIKNAEKLMHRTTFRLNEILHKSSGDDRVVLQSTLKKLNSIQDELLAQVLLH